MCRHLWPNFFHCSKYLEAPDPAMASPSSNSDSSSSSSSSQDSSSSFAGSTASTLEKDNEPYAVGEFRCSEVFRRTFKVHWRVPLTKVLSYLKNDVLRPFVVTNRTQMYVIEREHTVVYCHFSHIPITATTGYYDLEMTVHGLACPPWIERDVVPMIENRLTDEVTLAELQTFFSRNPTTKPTLSVKLSRCLMLVARWFKYLFFFLSECRMFILCYLLKTNLLKLRLYFFRAI
jgi:hypothetical protein